MTLADLARSWFRGGLTGLILTGICVASDRPGNTDSVPSPSEPVAAALPPRPAPGLPATLESRGADAGVLPAPIEESPRGDQGAEGTVGVLPRPAPRMLDRPIDPVPPPQPALPPEVDAPIGPTAVDPPLGYTGPSGILPTEGQQDAHFVPVEDRWRLGFPEWDRYGKGHPINDDYPFMLGRWFDPFNQNVLKGDYPILGQHTFLDLTAQLFTFQEFRQVPTATTPFESTARPNQQNFFGRPNQYFTSNFFVLAVDLNHGDAAFKPLDWKLRVMPIFNLNNLSVEELAVVSPNVLQGTSRTRTFWALQEAYFETKLADVGPDYDFVSVRAGTQPFNNDFRGFLFYDTNRAVRFFGTRHSNRDQWNLAYFRQWEKDTNSQLNSFADRQQNLVFANYYRQDFLVPGYTAQLSAVYNNDPRTFKFDNNRFLVRPDPVGVARPHQLDVAYLGWAGDGHIGRFNITHQFYWALGRDTLNPLANQAQTINAQMFAIEGSYDRDWARFRASFFWASGDHDINNSHATGFDTILDGPNFAGGPFSYWNRQQVPLFGVNLVQRLSLVPDLRSSKFQGQSNFVNPGLLLPTLGADFDLTPKLKMINNVNLLWFDQTNVLEQFLFQGKIDRFIGTDLSIGFDYRPLLSENVSIVMGVSGLIPGQGFRDLYNNSNDRVQPLVGSFLFANFVY
ncbi:hypothetical protein V5E97_01145 [Singulisphaera sp. Ch08]|uniref:Alginate export domain-containing protein n=1 Tax=Singulisphaera sp. Ch08 TaxID=3120278 RepID=A0AAU7CI13_9BACT